MLFGSTTILDGAATPDGNGRLPIIRQSTAPFRRERVGEEEITPEELNRILHNLQSNLHEIVTSVRKMPEAGSRTFIRNVSFSSGAAKTLPHMLAVKLQSKSSNLLGSASNLITVVDPESIRFEIVNQRVAAGACYRSAVDARTITLVPNATFIADVRLFVVP